MERTPLHLRSARTSHRAPRRALTLALAAIATFTMAASADAFNSRPPASCSSAPDTTQTAVAVGTPIVFHSQAPANATGTLHWVIQFGDEADGGYSVAGDSTGPNSTIDVSHAFRQPTGTSGGTARITYYDSMTDPNSYEQPCNVRYFVDPKPDLNPTAVLDVPASIIAGVPASFSAVRSTDPEGQPLSFQFDFDGDGAFETDAGGKAGATYTFPQAGSRTIQLRVTDPGGHTNDVSANITIQPAGGTPPVGPVKTPPPTGPDKTKPAATLKISTTLTSVESLGNDFVFSIDPSEDLTYTGKVTLKFKGRTYVVAKSARTETLYNSGGGSIEKTMRRGSVATIQRLNRIIPKGTKVAITLALSLKDTAGNTATVSKTVKILKRYRGSGRNG